MGSQLGEVDLKLDLYRLVWPNVPLGGNCQTHPPFYHTANIEFLAELKNNVKRRCCLHSRNFQLNYTLIWLVMVMVMVMVMVWTVGPYSPIFKI